MKKNSLKIIIFTALTLLIALNLTSTFNLSFGGNEAKAKMSVVTCYDDHGTFYSPGAVLRYCADCSLRYDWITNEPGEECDTSYPYVPAPFCPPNGCEHP